MKLSGPWWVLAAALCLAAPIVAFKLGGADLAGLVSPATGMILLFLQKEKSDAS